jgi:hypothetical protein
MQQLIPYLRCPLTVKSVVEGSKLVLQLPSGMTVNSLIEKQIHFEYDGTCSKRASNGFYRLFRKLWKYTIVHQYQTDSTAQSISALL